MRCKITLTGTFSEIQDALFMLTHGAHVDFVEEPIKPETITVEVKDPDTGDIHVIQKKSAATSSSRVRENDQQPAKIALQREETRKNGAVLNPDITIETEEKIVQEPEPKKTGKWEKAPDGLQVHCHRCGTLFHPKYMHTIHCSERCYQAEWYEKNRSGKQGKQKADIQPSHELPNLPTDQLTSLPAHQLDQKLDEIKKTCPAPMPRPNLNREIFA
jgi:hypothetical protein